MADLAIFRSLAAVGGSPAPVMGGAFAPFTPAVTELQAGLRGKVTLAVLDFTVLALAGFYYVTRKYQGE